MNKFGGFDENGQVITIECIKHHYSDLPMKGLGKSMDSVGIDEPLIIPQSAALEGVTWGYTEAEIERRAYELKSEVKWMHLPPILNQENGSFEHKIQMWFSKPHQ